MKTRVLVILALLATILFFAGQRLAQEKGHANNPAKASEAKVVKARPLPLQNVRLTGGPLKNAQDLDATYLLALEPDRMLAYLRQRAGLQPKAEGYGGWDGAGRQLTGHIAGHYLSAVSLMWAATGDVRFKDRADYIVKEMKEIQDKQGDGYIGAIMDRDNVDGKVRFQELAKGTIRGSNFDLNGLWSPWYVQHKIYAGLRDAYRYTGNRTALELEIKFAQWAENILAGLNEEQIQKMLATEFGAMNEIAADLYADTGDKRWLALSEKFHHRAVVDPLAVGKDILPHLHGNTQVPKLLGHLVRYIYTGNESDAKAARFFWNQVALHHSFATGGHGRNEYFGQPGKLNEMVDGRTAETCNVYNMVKLTRALFSVEPDMRYADFHERALFNHILASQDPEDGRVCYMVPVGRGVQHEYQDMSRSFTCCVGTGMESHALHAYGIYYESGDKLWVNLYAPSVADWHAAGVKLELATEFPEGKSASLKITAKGPKKFTLALRRPYWAVEGFSVTLNGQPVKDLPKPGSYVELNRTWKSGDAVELVLPKTLREEPLPDNPSRVALMWGPLVLAGDLGPARERRRREESTSVSEPTAFAPPPPAPPLVGEKQAVQEWLKPVENSHGTFRTDGVRLKEEINFTPFYRLPRRRYAIYWDKFTPVEWGKKAAALAAEQEEQKALEAATVSFVQPGREEAEKNFNSQGEDTSPARVEGRMGRRAGNGKWFSFDLPVDSASPMTLVVTLSSDARRDTTFDILVEGQKVGELSAERRSPEEVVRFFDVRYALPAELTAGKQKVSVRFQAVGENHVPGVFGIRIVRLP
ncbi:MAG: beta-L-arabinofuranosidase domain-containing protein [Candidatus Acidiferrales bacterium]